MGRRVPFHERVREQIKRRDTEHRHDDRASQAAIRGNLGRLPDADEQAGGREFDDWSDDVPAMPDEQDFGE